MNKGLSTEAGVFDTTTAGSSLAITPIAGVFQVLGLLVESLGDLHVLDLRAAVLSSTVETGLRYNKKLGLQDIDIRDIIILDLGTSELRELHELGIQNV